MLYFAFLQNTVSLYLKMIIINNIITYKCHNDDENVVLQIC